MKVENASVDYLLKEIKKRVAHANTTPRPIRYITVTVTDDGFGFPEARIESINHSMDSPEFPKNGHRTACSSDCAPKTAREALSIMGTIIDKALGIR